MIRRLMLAAVALAAVATATRAEAPPPTLTASILNWTAEQQAYGYRNMEKVARAGLVRHGRRVSALRVAAQQIEPVFTYDGKTWTLDEYMAAYRVSGVLVIRKGRIVLERYGLGRKPDERWTSFSVAKSVTSTLAGAALADGHIKSLDDPVTRYIPELRGSAYEGVTVRHLLTMTSGVKWNEDYSDPNSDVARAGANRPEPGVDPIVSYMRALPREAEPGAKWVYKTGETDLAGILVARAVGMPLSEYLSQKIWIPFGMEADAIWVKDAAGWERGGCCMSMTLRDYGRFGLFMLADGKAGGRRVVPKGWVADATAKHASLGGPNRKAGYGYFWWIPGNGTYEAHGIFGQMIAVSPETQTVVVINSAWPRAVGRDLGAPRSALVAAIFATK